MFFKKHGIYLVITIVGCVPAYLICQTISIDGIIGLFVRLIVCLVVSNILFFAGYRMLPEYHDAMKLVRRVTGMIKKRLV